MKTASSASRRRKEPAAFFMRGAALLPAVVVAVSLATAQPPVSGSTAAVVSPSTAPPAALAASGSGAEFVGDEACLGCHQNQAAFKTHNIHSRSFVKVKGIPADRACETCHGPGSLHAAAAGDRSNPGFSTIKAFKRMSAADMGAACLECHEGGAQMHWEGSAHAKRNVSCAACHSMHDPRGKGLLGRATVNQTCAGCHGDVASKVRRSHRMPVSEGKMSCSSCHNPHGSATPKMIRQASVNDNCYACHADKRGPFLWEHLPVRENCMNCHDAHGSHHPNMLLAKQPFLCQRCHVQQQHRSTAYDQVNINQLSNKVVFHSCTNCHSNIHGSNHPSGKFFTR